MLILMPNANTTDLQPAWTVTIENVGTVVASCEDEAYELYEHYRKACIADIVAGEETNHIVLRHGEMILLHF